MAEFFDNLAADYAAQRPQYVAFTSTLESLLKSVLDSQGIEYFSIEARTKDEDSFFEKLQREDKVGKYQSLADVTDLSGVRIIAYLEEDCDRIIELLLKSFNIDSKNSIRKTDELDADKFGYLSTHYVVELPSSRVQLLEYKRFDKMKAEIQVRTLLQHTWAAIDWKFRYKEEKEAPKAIRRRLFRISALLEAADNEFSAVKVALRELQSHYESEITINRSSIAIDTESIKSYVASSELAQSIIASAEAAGIRVLRNRDQNPPIGVFIKTLRELGVETIEDLNRALEVYSPKVNQFFAQSVEFARSLGRTRPLQLYPPAIIRYALIAGSDKNVALHILRAQPVAESFKKALEHYIDQKT